MHILLGILPWVISAVTVYAMWLAGKKDIAAWPVSLFNQGLWLIWILLTHTWGLLPMNIALWIVFSYNHKNWTKI